MSDNFNLSKIYESIYSSHKSEHLSEESVEQPSVDLTLDEDEWELLGELYDSLMSSRKFSEPEVISICEKTKCGMERNKKKKKPARWWDDDGDGIGYEKGEVSKEETELGENRAAMRNPEEYERSPEARAGRAARGGINNPRTGINSPAFAEFMRQQMGGSKPKPKPKSDLKNSYEPEVESVDEGKKTFPFKKVESQMKKARKSSVYGQDTGNEPAPNVSDATKKATTRFTKMHNALSKATREKQETDKAKRPPTFYKDTHPASAPKMKKSSLNAGYTPEELEIISEVAPMIASALGGVARTVATNAVKSAATNAAGKGVNKIKSLLGGNQQQEV